MMIKLLKLEKQVRRASQQNRAQLGNIAYQGHLLKRSLKATAAKPVVLASAVVVGACIGAHQNRCPSADTGTGITTSLLGKALPLAVSYIINIVLREKLLSD